MYVMYIYNIMEQNSLNCPGEQLRGLLVEILPKARDRWEYGWAPDEPYLMFWVWQAQETEMRVFNSFYYALL